ncbi:transposase domain-containing protein [Undibacterium sp. Di26W]|uniref:transposase domain-containing protein n=1 Tax=Undibacterium sp. Di26W TaxID=3413035 RepID=UPI003BF1B33D
MLNSKNSAKGKCVSPQTRKNSSDLSKNRSELSQHTQNLSSDLTQGRMNKGVSSILEENQFQPKSEERSELVAHSLTIVEVAQLESVTERAIRKRCNNGTYLNAKKETLNGGEGWLIPLSSLSKTAQKTYIKHKATKILDNATTYNVAELAPKSALPNDEYNQLWERYERKGSNFKEKARNALLVVLAYLELLETGVSIGFAEKAIESSHGASRATLRRYLDYIKGHPRQHWEPLLCPDYHGGRKRAEFTPAAYEFLLALKIKSPASNLRVLIRATLKEGVGKGWVLPNEDTIAKRLKEEPAWVFNTREQLERSFPTAERDYSSLALHEMWDSDGRKADVWCVWPDGTINRPFVIAIREVRTRRVLSIRVCHAPDAEAVLGAYGSALSRANAVPKYFNLDNGREYANKAFTGHQRTRYRFKYNTEEAQGILTAMDVKVKWSKPGQGRGKSIESWWNVIGDNCDRAPDFIGAYCGHNPLAKPEDFDKNRAVSIDVYAAKLIEVITQYEKGDFGGHRGQGMNGKTVLQVYEELAKVATVRQPTVSEIRRCRMGVKSLKLDKKDATIRFAIEGYLARRYWHEALSNLPPAKRERHFNVHYEWGNPEASISVYCGDEFICDAAPIGSIPFNDHEGELVRKHMTDKGEYLKPRANFIKTMKAKAGIELPQLENGASLSLPPIASGADTVIAPSTKVQTVEELPPALQPVAGNKNQLVSTKTGQIYQRKDLEKIDKMAEEQKETEARNARLEELRKRKLEKDLAHLKAG